MSADTSNARVKRPARAAGTVRPNTRKPGWFAREELPGRTDQNAAAAPRRRVYGGRAAAPQRVTDTLAEEEPVRPGPSPDPGTAELELLAADELVRLRDVYNRPSGGQWAVFYDPFRRRWFAVRGKDGWVSADTPAALEKLIDRA